jgi:PAS domain S-box-containing protein
MDERKSILLWSSLIMTAISIVVVAVVIPLLYEAAFEGQTRRLAEIAQSHARLLEAIAAAAPGPEAALLIMRQAHENFAGFGTTGEFSLARRDGGQIEFLLHRRHAILANPTSVAFVAVQERPIGRALSGLSGTMVGLDYRGERVLAAYEPVAHLHWGIVAKIDLSEIRIPFIRAGAVAAGVTATLVLCGVVLFLRVSDPLIRRLEESEASTQTILNTAPDGIISFGASGTIHSLNHAAERLFGYLASEVIGQDVSHLIPSLSLDQCDDSLTSKAEHQVRTERGLVHEATGQRRDGGTFPVDMAMSAVRVGERRLFTCIVRDITQRQHLEGQLRQLQKMEAVGTLAGGIAHDFNNILAAILGYTELALSKITRHSLSKRYLQEVLTAAKRAKDLVQQTLAFSRRTEAERRPVRLVPLVREALSLLRAALPSTIEIRQYICTGFSHSVDADRAKALRIDAFLAKPIEVCAWAVTIQRVLQQHCA